LVVDARPTRRLNTRRRGDTSAERFEWNFGAGASGVSLNKGHLLIHALTWRIEIAAVFERITARG
jgi:hypothetical protein